MVKFNNIFHTYNSDILSHAVTALKNINFEIQPNKITGFLGANGAGKTTCIKILLKLINPSKGEVEFHPSMGQSFFEINQNIGYMPERAYYYPSLKGLEFIFYMGQLSKLKPTEIADGIKKWAPVVGLRDEALKRSIRTYSKGMLQRLELLVTVIHDPKFIILDEPASGLDPVGRKEVKDLLVRLNSEGKTILFTTHVVSDIEDICHNVIFLKNHEVFFNGKLEDIIQSGISNYFQITFLDANKKLITQKIEKSQKDKIISEILEKKFEIYSLTPIQKSLEEVIFDV